MRVTRLTATRAIAGVLVSLLMAGLAEAKSKTSYSRGVLSEMQSVSCGYMQKSGPTVAGALITGAEHSKSHELLCQEYTLKTDRVTYHIRPKEEKHPALLPVGEEAEFRLKKDQMLLRIPESDNKEREYIVVSMAPTQEFASEIENTRRPPKPHGKALKVDDSAATTSGISAPASGNSSGEQAMAASAAPPGGGAPAVAVNSSAALPASPAAPTAAAPTSPASVSQTQSTAASSGASGSVQVQSTPAGAEVYVDSAIAGRTPALLTLKQGPHSIQVVLPGYKDWITNVNVAAGTQQEVSANLSH